MTPRRTVLTTATAALMASTLPGVMAAEEPQLAVFNHADVALEAFLWTNRVVIVFADTPADPRFIEQLDLLTARPDALLERDVVIITDSEPEARSDLRRKLRPRGFGLVLVGKDGTVALRKPEPWDVRELNRSIDKMPMRQREIRERKAAGSG